VHEDDGRLGAVAVATELERGRLAPLGLLLPARRQRPGPVLVYVVLEQLRLAVGRLALVEVVEIRAGRAARVLEDDLGAARDEDRGF